MVSKLVTAVVALMVAGSAGTASAATYTRFNDFTLSQLGFVETPDATPGYVDADATFSITNNAAAAMQLYVVQSRFLLNNTDTTWSSAQQLFSGGTYTAQITSANVLAAYEDTPIPEPLPVGYVPGGTIPLYSIGLVAPGQTKAFDIAHRSNAQVLGSYAFFVLSGPAVPVPEPVGWAVMVVGMGAIGAMARRHRATAPREPAAA